jgi:hypothetical protein
MKLNLCTHFGPFLSVNCGVKQILKLTPQVDHGSMINGSHLFPETAEVDGTGCDSDWTDPEVEAAAASAELYSDKPLFRIEVSVRRPKKLEKNEKLIKT